MTRIATVAAAALLLATGQARAAIVTFTRPVTAPATFAGVHINLGTGETTGETGPPDLSVAYNLALRDCSGLCFQFWAGSGQAFGVSDGAFKYLDLPAGSVISKSTVLAGSALPTIEAAAAFQAPGHHTLGFFFSNPATNLIDYGYMDIVVGPGGGLPATITGWSYEDTGGAITVPTATGVVEPSTWTMMIAGFAAIGSAMRLQRSRRRRSRA